MDAVSDSKDFLKVISKNNSKVYSSLTHAFYISAISLFIIDLVSFILTLILTSWTEELR